jgi:flagellar FliL protein
VTLDKVLVMLHLPEENAAPHYLSIDLVFKCLPDDEKRAKDHLPMLRAVAVRALSTYTLQAASAMSVDQVADVLNKAFAASYAEEHHEAPFATAMVGKLIIE